MKVIEEGCGEFIELVIREDARYVNKPGMCGYSAKAETSGGGHPVYLFVDVQCKVYGPCLYLLE